jgi:hypothetical protein
LNSALTEYLEQSTPLGYSTIFKVRGRPCIVVLYSQNPEIIKLELVDPSFDIIKYFRKICQLLVVGSVYSVGMAIWLGALEHVCFKDEAMCVFCNDSHLGALRCLSL